MGAAFGGFSYTTSITMKTKGKSRRDIDRFKNYCSLALKDIMDALLAFDYTSLINEGCSVIQVVNETNLFFRRGMYFDQPLPPIRHVDIINADISGLTCKLDKK